MKLLIAIPVTDNIPYQFTECLLALTKKLILDDVNFDVKMQGDTLVYIGRSTLADEAIHGKYTHVLWLDSDMIFEPDIFDKLLATGKPFVTGICHARRAPHAPCLYKSLKPVKRFVSATEYPNEVFRVGACGFGCVLIETYILQAVKKLCYYPFLPTMDMGEDIAFCNRADSLGFEIWADPDCKLGHLSRTTIYPNN